MDIDTKKMMKIMNKVIAQSNGNATFVLDKLFDLSKNNSVRNLSVVLPHVLLSDNVFILNNAIDRIADVAHNAFLNDNHTLYTNMINTMDKIRTMKKQPKYSTVIFKKNNVIFHPVSLKEDVHIITDAENAVNNVNHKNRD